MLKSLNQWKERYFTRTWHFLRAMRAAKGLRRQRFWAILRRRFPLPRWLKRRRQGIWLSCDHPFFDNRRRPILSGIVAFHGWAVATGGIESITISCDGRFVAEATYGSSRPDVSRLGVPGAYKSGYYCHVDSRKIPAGMHQLTVTATSKDGLSTSVSRIAWVIDQPTDYDRWRHQNRVNSAGHAWMKRNSECLHFRPRVSLAMPVLTETDVAFAAITLQSLKAQAYPDWELCIACDRQFQDRLDDGLRAARLAVNRVQVEYVQCCTIDEARNLLLQRATGGLFGLIDAGDVLEPHALFEIVYCWNRHPNQDLVYADEDAVCDANQRRDPFFKPDWSPQLLLSFNYVGRLWIARKQLVEQVGGFRAFSAAASEYDLLLRMTEPSQAVGHVRTVLYGRNRLAGQGNEPAHDARRALEDALKRRQVSAVLPGRVPGTWRVQGSLVDDELVSIIVPLENERESFKKCLDSIRNNTSYRHYEIVVPHRRGDISSGLRSALEFMKVRLVECLDGSNSAQLMNAGAENASGKYLLFIGVVEAVTNNWLQALLEHAQVADVGAVGARLIDAQARVLHAGYFLTDSGSGARNSFRSFSQDDPGYFGLAGVARECVAVSSSALMVRRNLFEELGSFDERLTGIQRDVDFCLQVQREGYRVITTPYAVLRKADESKPDCGAEAGSELYWERWRSVYEMGDPYYSPNLTVRRDDWSINEEPVLLTHAASAVIEPEGIENILVMKMDHLGDLVLTLPATRRLRQLFPAAEITALVGSWSRSIIENEPAIDRVLTYDLFHSNSTKPCRILSPEEEREVWKWLSSQGFDLAIDFRREDNTRDFLRLSGARYTVGFNSDDEFDSFTLSLPWEPKIQRRQARRHVSQDPLGLVELLAAACWSGTAPETALSIPASENVEQLLQGLPEGDGPLIGIHPGSGRAIKCWATEQFARLADLAVERLGARIVVFGGPGDEPLAQNILRHMRHGDDALSLAGRLTIQEFLVAARACDLFVGNDSGPAHLTGAACVPTLAVYAGTIDAAQWAPLGPNAVTLYRGMMCAPCYFSEAHKCPYQVACLNRLPVEQVYEAAVRTLLPKWPALRRRSPDAAARSWSPIADVLTQRLS